MPLKTFIVIGVAVVSAIAVHLSRRLALKKALLDHPNERSSHVQPLPRLGGAAFMPALFLAIGLLAPRTALPLTLVLAFLGGAIALFAVSLADDFFTLSTTLRFAVQFAAAAAFMTAVFSAWPAAAVSACGISVSIIAPDSGAVVPWSLGLLVLWSLLALWIVGTLNIYNFMDGIDGIAGLQAVVAGIAWCVVGNTFGAPFVSTVGALAAAGAAGFLTLNWPPAKIFMGDAGSTVLGFFFATLPLLAAVETRGSVALDRLLLAGALALWPFLLDGTFTIFRRLNKGENVLKAHRSHLYQRLVVAGKSHLEVTLVYGSLAVIGVVSGWLVLAGAAFGVPVAFGVVGVLFFALWAWTVQVEKRSSAKALDR